MRAFVKKTEYHFKYPEEMKAIIEYLGSRGTLNINYDTLEDFYYDFSEERYSAGWMKVNSQMLEEFMEYLSKKEI